MTMAESMERRPPKPLQKQVEFEEAEDEHKTHSPSSDQSDTTITAGTDTPGAQSSSESPSSVSPEDCKPDGQDRVDDHFGKNNHSQCQKTKPLRRSTALCETDEDGSPPPDGVCIDGSGDVLSLPQANTRGRLEEEGSQSSEAGTSLSSSRDSSVDISYTDSTGIDLEDFIKRTLNKTPKDKKILLKLETDLIKFVKEPEHHFLKFPPMSSYDRMLVHRVAAFFGLDHNIDQTGRSVIVNKTAGTRLPEFSFMDHIQETDSQVSKKQILKRDGGSLEETHKVEKPHLSSQQRTKSLEERQQEYNETRARIFKVNPGQISQEDVRQNILKKPSRPGSLVNSKEDLGSRPWSSTDSSGYGTDSSVKSRVPVTKAGSFGGFPNTHSAKAGVFRGGSLSKTDSISSGTSSTLGSPMLCPPVIPCTPPRSLSDVSPHSGSSSLALQTPLQTSAGSATQGQGHQYFLVVSGFESIPPGSMIVNPQTGQLYMNPDGSVYRHNPNQSLPPSMSFNPAGPPQVFSQHPFVMEARQYPTDSTGIAELSQQLANVQMNHSSEGLELAPGSARQPSTMMYSTPPQVQQPSGSQPPPPPPPAAYAQGSCYPTHGVTGQPFRYMVPVPILTSGQQNQGPTGVPMENQGPAQAGPPAGVGQYHQAFMASLPSYSYQPVTSQSSESYPSTNYAPAPTMGQLESNLSGFSACASSYPTYGQNNFAPQTSQYYTVSPSNPQLGYNFGSGGTFRPTTPPSQVPVSSPNVPINVGQPISIVQPMGSSPTATAPTAQYVPYHNYSPYAAQPRAPNPQIMQFSTAQVHPTAQSFPVMRPNMQINMQIPTQGTLSAAQGSTAQAIHSPMTIKNFNDLRLPKDSGTDSSKEYNNNASQVATATGPGSPMVRANTGDPLRFISASGFRPQLQPLQFNHQRTRPHYVQYILRRKPQYPGDDPQRLKDSRGFYNRPPNSHGSCSGGSVGKQKGRKSGKSKDICSGSQTGGGNGDGDSRGNVTGSNVLEVYDLPPNLRQPEVEKLLKDLTSQGASLHYVTHDSSVGDTSNLQVSECKTILAIFRNAPIANKVLQSSSNARYKLRSTVSGDSLGQNSER